MTATAIRWVSRGLAVWLLSVLCPFTVEAMPPGGSASWPKTFYDEFAGTSIDTSKWGYGTLPWSSGRYHKAEYSSYIMPEDSYVTNGLLVLRCRHASGSEFGGYPCSEGMVHSKGFKPSDREELPVKREITIDAIENFLGRIVSGNPENAIERSVLSTCVGLLGREAIYTGREVTWQSYVGPLI